jgi:hypothetical protein
MDTLAMHNAQCTIHTRSANKQISKIWLFFLCILCIGCAVSCVNAAMIQGEPDLEAKVLGTNELVPGTDIYLTILVSNVAVRSDELKTDNNSAYDSLIAMGLKATPHAGDAPLTVKSDAVMIGDLAPGKQREVGVYVTIAQSAAPGVYYLPLTLSYNYVGSTVEYESESVRTFYVSKEIDIVAQITIVDNVQVSLHSISVDSLNVGHEGIVTLEIENTGHGTGYNTVAHYYNAVGSPLVPVDGTAFIGTFAPGQKENLAFKLRASTEAEANAYPGGLVIEYIDESGITHKTDPRMFGVQVGEKLTFKVVNSHISIHPGETKTFEIEIVNTGVTTAHGAQAKASVLIPFTGVHDRYSLGDLAPGATAKAEFSISSDIQSVIKSYKMDVFIRYNDDLGNSRVSDAMVITVDIVPRTGLDAFLHNVVLMSVLGGLIVIFLYGVYAVRKEKREKSEQKREEKEE